VIDFNRLKAGRDIHINLVGAQANGYIAAKGPHAYQHFIERPGEPWDSSFRGRESIDSLRTKLLGGDQQPAQPVRITVRGTLFPCALLTSGWWEKHTQSEVKKVRWRDEIQEWLFRGFEEWGPSWDFTWDFEHWDVKRARPYYIAQLGSGDEANSLPVLLPREKALRLADNFERWGGVEADVTGMLGHRTHFAGYIDERALDLFGGLLNYCLWLDEDDKSHCIEPCMSQTDFYSGYLWKCVAPSKDIADGRPSLNDVYFVWEHANFASDDAVRYSLDGLQRKVEYIEQLYPGDELVLVQKSSRLVPGTPVWEPQDIYRLLTGKRNVII
jgi:hypothetical protein